jgi:hypothetical protein
VNEIQDKIMEIPEAFSEAVRKIMEDTTLSEEERQ